jgi:two-component system, NtrC family, response regulator
VTGSEPRLLAHAALETAPERSLREAVATVGLSDRRRVGIVLQGAALLAHLDAAGMRLARGWEGAGLSAGGELCGASTAPGKDGVSCQERLGRLVESLFCAPERVAGRGEARRAVRRLQERWRPDLVPLAPHRAVTDVLELAPFLWEEDGAVDREALAAELRRDGTRTVLLAGAGAGGWPRSAPVGEVAALRCVLAGPEARRLWSGDGAGDPARLIAAGRWSRAVAAWALRGDGPGAPHPAGGEEERLAHGEALLALGRFAAAAELLGELATGTRDRGTGFRAEALRLRARLLLGELEAVRRRLARLASEDLPPDALVEVADIAQRVHAAGRRPERGGFWVRRALAETCGGDRLRAELVAAAAAWDRGDSEAMDRHLAAAHPAAHGPPGLAWRFHQAAGWRALAAGRGAEMVASLTRALSAGRRLLHRHQAAGLWSDLGVGRARVGDLAGAERAFLHAQRLLAGCDGPRRTTLALCNLAEVRVRRGRIGGVAEVLERSLEENRLGGNLRGQVHDLALWARFELVLGRPEAALAHCREARELLDAEGLVWHRGEVRLFEARALGWLGAVEEAAEALEAVGPEALGELEPEERPALFALAGRPDEAREAARESGFEALWEIVLQGREAPLALWRELEKLEPYRAARLVRDAELLHSGVVPEVWRRRAAAAFRRIGATGPAERLEAAEGGPWRALARYLERGARDLADLRRLFEDAGYPELRLERYGAEGYGDCAEVLVGGAGGPEELSLPLAAGRLVLRAPALDDRVRALFAVAARELDGRGGAARPAHAPPERRGGDDSDGLAGECPALRRAAERAGRLARGDLPVLVLGESGTGKELLARLVHRRSPRARKPFVAINCAALSETLLLSDLFGHVRGSFTGADRDRAGVFETAQGGTVLLDEIGDLPLPAQGMLLRVLQEGEVRRVGESLPRKVDVRVVAATHRDLTAMVREGSFRQDLFFRLSVARVELPPLRDRGEDVALLAERFLSGAAGAHRLSSQARSRLLAHPWPGNVRELHNVLEVAAALADGGEIRPEHLELPPAAPRERGDYHSRVDACRLRLIEEALEASGGNQSEAARRLGLSRQALSYLVKQLRLV